MPCVCHESMWEHNLVAPPNEYTYSVYIHCSRLILISVVQLIVTLEASECNSSCCYCFCFAFGQNLVKKKKLKNRNILI